LFNPAYALAAAVIWAFSPIYYRGFLEKFDFLGFNFLRNALASSVLLIPAALLQFGGGLGLGYAALSGPLTLACGDSMFLLSIRESGASVATPVVYVYVLMIQLVGVALGQVVPYANLLAAVLVVLGVFVLSKGAPGGKPRTRGIALAIGAGVMWTIGQELIQASTAAGGNFVAVTFVRNGSAALALGAALLLTGRFRRWPTGISSRDYAFIGAIIVSDLVAGSLFFVYSISTIGVALTVILTSLSPLLTQVASKALGKESPTPLDYLGGVLIVGAIVLAVSL